MAQISRQIITKGIEDDQLTGCRDKFLDKLKRPEGSKGRSISSATDKLVRNVSDMRYNDGIVLAGIQVQAAGDPGDDPVEGGYLEGGAKVSKKSLEALQKKFNELPDEKREELITKCAEKEAELSAKMAEASQAQLQCIMEKHPEFVEEVRSVYESDEVIPEDFHTLFYNQAQACSQLSSGSECESNESCVSSSVSGSKRCNPQILGQTIRDDVVGNKKRHKRMYEHLIAVYNKYHAKRARCKNALTADEEEPYKNKIYKIYKKIYGVSEADVATEANELMEHMRTCADNYKKPPSEVDPEVCVKSPVPGSRKYIPKMIMQYKDYSKGLREAQRAEADLSLWWNQFYAKQQRLNSL
jgi:hypothetical protein